MDYQELIFDPQVIRRFDVNGPRYTSYPTADRFVEAFGADDYTRWLGKRTVGGIGRPLSLYVHIPFCNTICYYCACNKIITKDHGRSAKYIKYLGKEIAMQEAALDGSRDVVQLHFGGGTPTFLAHDEMQRLMDIIRKHFRLLPGGEYSIEVDPRKVGRDNVRQLADLGFNHTLDEIIKLDPDRLSIYNYAHLPSLAKPQRRINEADLPSPDARLQILQLAIRRLTDAGYVFIGMDHFAKPNDELAVAQRQGRLHRNFQGYSTHAEADLMAFGVSAIGKVGPSYCQNVRTLDEYYDSLDQGVLPIFRGIELNADDLLRRSIIQALMCHFELSIESIEIAHLIDFKSYFASELDDLREMEKGGLLTIDDQWISVEPRGRLLVRGIAMAFDRYLRTDRERVRYSKVI